MEVISKYFPSLTQDERDLLTRYMQLIRVWNTRVNVISRKDIDNLEAHHILHALAIQKWATFKPGTRLLDIGTGGGLPGIPLAILNRNCKVHMIDARRKKVDVVKDIIYQLGLENASCAHCRAEEMEGSFDFVVSRAVSTLSDIYRWAGPLLSKTSQNALPNGCIVLKGGDLRTEIQKVQGLTYVEIHPIGDFYTESYFSGKYLVYLQVSH